MTKTLQQQLNKRHGFAVPEEEVYLNVQRTHGVLAGPLAQLFKRHDLSAPLYNILRILRGVGAQGLPCSQIGQRMVTREPDVTRLIDRLERAGWVARRRSDADRRVVNVVISRSGLKLVDRLDKPVAELHREELGHLTREEMRELNRLLVKARQVAEQRALATPEP
ncbi:MAG: MarR family transcriptional regulator [Planctomycetales bacterium]|nr:MarR family transcriptional regulator [Planctomycetales bacterium]